MMAKFHKEFPFLHINELLHGIVQVSEWNFDPTSGVARKSPLLGHSMGALCLYELPCKVQKLIGGSGGILPPKI